MSKVVPKNGYKIEKLRFGKLEEIPKEWNEKPLDFFLKLNMGQSPSSDDYNSDQEGIPFIQGVTEFGEKYPEIQVWCTKPKKIAEKNEILFSVRAPVGRMNLTHTKICIGRGIASLKPKGANNLLYCYYLLQHYIDRFIPFSQGIPYDAINKPSLSQTTFPFSENEDEQKGIAKIISNVDESIERINKLIEQMKLLKKKMMQELLTKGLGHKKFKIEKLHPKYFKEKIPLEWEIKKTTKIGKVVSGGTPKTNKKEFWADGNIVWLNPEELTNMNSLYIGDSKRKITELGLSNSSAKLLPKGTILVTTRATIGSLAIAEKPLSTNQGFQNVICNENHNNIFLYYSIKLYQKSLIALAHQTTFLEINKKNFSEILFPVPKDPKEEDKIVSILMNVEKKNLFYKKQLNHFFKLKKGITQKLLSGQVRIKI